MIVGLLVLAAQARPAIVTHDAVVDGDELRWTTRAWGQPAEPHRLAFPLPAQTRAASPSDEDQLMRDERGRVTAVHGRQVTLVVPREERTLTVPLWETPDVQRVDVRGVRFVPDDASGLTKTVTGWLGPGVDRAQRREADRAAGLRARATDPAIHLVVNGAWSEAGGIPGTLRPEGSRARWVWPFLALVGVALAVGGYGLFWSMERRARVEQIEAYIASEFEGHR